MIYLVHPSDDIIKIYWNLLLYFLTALINRIEKHKTHQTSRVGACDVTSR